MGAAGNAPAIVGLEDGEAPARPYEFRAIVQNVRGFGKDAQADRLQESTPCHDALEQVRRESFEQGRREGERAAHAEMEAGLTGKLAEERKRVADVLREFRETRNRYFSDAEREVVRLALAIAARVLHREVQLDPLLLTGVVRVALSQLADRSGVVLCVPEADVALWQDAFSGMEPGDRPAITGTASLARGECVLETSVGSVELGVTAQLEEIERGFFDLLSHRPTT
jgi:flagellar assembly protein FliH